MTAPRSSHDELKKFFEKEEVSSPVENEHNISGEELEICNGTNEINKGSQQKCVVRLENSRVYASRQSGCQCIKQNCYEGLDVNLLKCAVCRSQIPILQINCVELNYFQ